MKYIKKATEKIFKNKLARETSWSFLNKGTTFVLYFLLNIYLARTLDISDFGEWSYFYSIFTAILYFSLLGINAAGRKYIAANNNTERLSSVLRSSLQLRVIFSLLFALLVLFTSHPLSIWLNRPDLEILLFFSAPLIFLGGCLEYIKSAFSGLHRIKYNFIINIVEYGLKLFFAILFLHFSFRILSILGAFIISTVLAMIIGLFLLKKNFYSKESGESKESFHFDILRYSLPLYLVGIGFLISTEVDTIMLGWLTSDTEVGLYAIPKQIIGKFAHISTAIAMGTLPVFAKLNKENKKKLKKLYHRLLRINCTIYLFSTIIILLFSGFFIPLIFGEKYVGSVLPMQILTVYLLCTPFRSFSGAFLTYQGIVWKRASILLCSTIINIAMNYVLIPKYGAIGAASATAVAYLPYALYNWVSAKKCFN